MINERLYELRKMHNLTQKEIAQALGIHSVTYLHYEKGHHEPSLDSIVKIAKFYDVSTDYLLGNTDKI